MKTKYFHLIAFGLIITAFGNSEAQTCSIACLPSTLNVTETCNVTSGECLYGCYHGFAGPNCSEPCPDNCARTTDPIIDTCDAETGECSSGCFYGFTGDNCTVPCPTNCAKFPEGGEQITCNATTLECTNGCDVTYTGSYCNDSCSTNCDRCNNPSECTECRTNSYRDNGKCIDCAWQCNHATDSTLRICREEDGRCEFGCLREYYGERCKTRCSSTCKHKVCEGSSGECLYGCLTTELMGLACDKRCNAGCKGIKCNQSGVCLDGCFPTFWGGSCDNICSDNCRDGSTPEANICDVFDGTCLYGCKDDLHWTNQCTTVCSEFCVNGICEQMSGNCTGGCSSDNVYGIDCKEPCSTNCVTGTCFQDGYCKLGCPDGWYGDHCYKQCGHCYDDVCVRDDGTCSSGCETGWFGTHCTERCGLNCVNVACDIDTGSCTLGCVFGSHGPKCDQGESLNGCITTELTGLTYDTRCNAGCKGLKCYQSGVYLDGCYTLLWDGSCNTICHNNCRDGPTSETNSCGVSDGACLYGCKDDLFLENQCTTECSDFCVNGVCEQISGNCKASCSSDEVYGINCKEPCSANCVNGTCFRDCYCKLGCLGGWYGDHGYKCEQCYDNVCDRDDGSCSSRCETGWLVW